MVIKIQELLDTNLYIGDKSDAHYINKEDWAVIHATQTIHYRIFNWNRTTNKPDKNHPNYIKYKEGDRFSLNWVDGPAYLYKMSGPETFIEVLDFIDKWIKKKKVLVHCDQGYSRSPSIGLLYLAKRSELITDDSFEKAKKEFLEIYPYYSPGGIADYIDKNWKNIE